MAALLQRTVLFVFLLLPLVLVCSQYVWGFASVWLWAAALATVSLPAGLILLEFGLLRWRQQNSCRGGYGAHLLVRLWAGEVLVAAKSFLWDQAFCEHRYSDAHPGRPSLRGVVLVHGYLCNRGFWNAWIPRLRAANISYVCVSLEPVFGSIDDSSEQVAASVKRSIELTGEPPVVVTHSMGGLSVRAAMARYGDNLKVHHVVTIACPHQGTALAKWGVSEKEKQMRPDSAWLQDLERNENAELREKLTSFHSDCDNVVFPPELATFPGAQNRLITQRAHLQLASSPEVFAEVLRLVHS